MGRLLQLNYTPVSVDGATIQLQTIPFRDSEQFRSLRDQYRGQHAVTRRGDLIALLPLAADAPVLGTESQMPLAEGFSLIRPLLESRLISLLSSNRRPVARYSPLTTVGRTLPTGFADGRVGGIVGDKARLSERFHGVEEFLPLDDLYLEASPENIRSPYRKVLPVIWDQGRRIEQYDLLIAGLNEIRDVVTPVLVPQPAFMG